MKKQVCTVIALLSTTFGAYAANVNHKMGIVSFEKVVDSSDFMKAQINTLEAMQTQDSAMLEQKQAELDDIAAKLDDPDYRDGLSPEAEQELIEKQGHLAEELQFYEYQRGQTYRQAGAKIQMKLLSQIEEVCQQIAKTDSYSMIFMDNGVMYYDPSLDISEIVVKKVNELYQKQKVEEEASLKSKSETKK